MIVSGHHRSIIIRGPLSIFFFYCVLLGYIGRIGDFDSGPWEGPCEWEGPRKTVLVLVLFVPMWFLCCFFVFVGPFGIFGTFWSVLMMIRSR